MFKDEIWSPVATKLSWSHYVELLPLKDREEQNYYINECLKYNLSRDKLREKIKLKEYERLPEETKNKLIKKEHLGQIGLYMNYINKNIKTIYQNETIGIIVCYKNNELIIEYSSDSRIHVTEYEVVNN